MFTLVKLIAVGSATWVYYDATSKKIGRIPGRTGWDNLPAGAWGLGALWLWIIAFPFYLAKRNELISRAQEQPCEASYPRVKLGIFALFFIMLLLTSLTGGGGTITFAEAVDRDLNTTNEGTHFSPGWVQMVIRGDEPYEDTTLSVFVRQSGTQAWVPFEEHTVSAEWDTFTTPVLLDGTGKYDIKVEGKNTSKLIAEGTVYIE